MIRCQTISRKDSFEEEEFLKLRQVMRELFPQLHAAAQLRIFSQDCWMYCLRGKDPDRHIMLMSHHDVVPAGEGWTKDPFSGEISGGRIWGRGTVDTKTPLFAEFSAVEELLEQDWQPPVNLYLVSSHNEELAGDGVPEAVRWCKEQGITFDVILDEGGAVIEPPLGGMKCEKCAMVAVHEKSRVKLICTASGSGGHAGLTAAATASPSERMAEFIHAVRSQKLFIRRLNPQIRAMFDHLAPYCSFPMKQLLTNLWLTGGLIKAVLPRLNPQAGGLIGSTCAFQEMRTDEKKACTAIAMLKAVDGEDLRRDLETLRRVAAQYGVDIRESEDSEYHEPADMSRPEFAYLMDCLAAVFPQHPASPFILPAGTDARHFTDICQCVLRFAPITLRKEQLASVHNADENLDICSIGEAVEFYKYFLIHYPA